MDIRDLRKQTGWSQRDFANYFGLPVRSLQEWEQGRKRPPRYLVELLVRLLDAEKGGVENVNQ